MKRLFLLPATFFAVLLIMGIASACLTVNAKDTAMYLNEIPSISSQLGSCTIALPSSAGILVSTGNILVSISMNDGTTEQFYFTLQNKVVTGITTGAPSSYTHEVTLSESTLDGILSATDPTNEILRGIKTKAIHVRASGVFGKLKWFFAQFFVPSPSSSPATTTGPTGKPDYCDETYLPGHQGYAENKDLWDSYSSDTDKVCQSQYGRGTPSPCVHTVQLSVSGNPYYLCWYNE